ncbi:MAG: glycosyltransferase WbuB, partial [Candidatus Cloacimonetes bacterium]|nr:glycosyltransferase WbuB [Candidatus Cloacimonadota bacterium]
MTSLLAGKRIVIIIEGISLPAYTKLWDMARALRDAGAEIAVICPATLGAKPGFERLEDIDIHRHPLFEANTPYGFILEYAGAILFESWILLKILLRGKINVIHGASPPDL